MLVLVLKENVHGYLRSLYYMFSFVVGVRMVLRVKGKSKTPLLSGVGQSTLVDHNISTAISRRTKRMKEKEIQHIREDIPITGYDPKNKQLLLRDGVPILMYQIRSKDLVNADPDEIEIELFCWAEIL